MTRMHECEVLVRHTVKHKVGIQCMNVHGIDNAHNNGSPQLLPYTYVQTTFVAVVCTIAQVHLLTWIVCSSGVGFGLTCFEICILTLGCEISHLPNLLLFYMPEFL